jgi:hypothetical protein
MTINRFSTDSDRVGDFLDCQISCSQRPLGTLIFSGVIIGGLPPTRPLSERRPCHPMHSAISERSKDSLEFPADDLERAH